jgi:hypothetical protein
MSYTVEDHQLGRAVDCVGCGVRFRFASPVGLLVAVAATATASSTKAPTASSGGPDEDDDWPDTPIVLDANPTPAAEPLGLPNEDARSDAVPRQRPAAPTRGGPRASVLVLLALVALVGGAAGGWFLVRHFINRDDRPTFAENTQPVEEPPPHKPPEPGAPIEQQPKPPDPPKPVEQKPKPPEPPKPEKKTLQLPAPITSVVAGGDGRFLAFHIAALGQVITYDTVTGRRGTFHGADVDTLVAAGREKIFLGRPKDGRIVRFDLKTGMQDLIAKQDNPQPLRHMAMGSSSDSPLLLVVRDAGQSKFRLLNPDTFSDYHYELQDPRPGYIRSIPFTTSADLSRTVMSADGRALTLYNAVLERVGERFRGRVLPSTAGFLPSSDGQLLLGPFATWRDGRMLGAAPPPGKYRRFIPAAGGPFFVCAEYGPPTELNVKLFLHVDQDAQPLGPLPGSEVVMAWATTEPNWALKLQHRLFFVPNPGLVVFVPPGSDTAQLLPVDLPAMLARSGRDVLFTSVAPAEVRRGQAYTYQATAIARHGPVTFALESGPAGMTVAADGVLTWARHESFTEPTADVRLAARDAAGKTVVQTFTVLLPPKADAPKEDPKDPPPKIDLKFDPPKVDRPPPPPL